MALELVGGALLSSMFQVTFEKLASSAEVWAYFRGRKLNENLLKKLNIKLRSISVVVDDAEQKMFRNKDVRAWLDEVKDAVLEAEDLLDEIDIQVSKTKLEAESQTDTSVGSFDKEIESRMQEVLDNLEYLASQRDMLGLTKAGGSGVGSGGQVSQKLPSTSLLGDTVVYGRDDDKEDIFNWLMSDTENELSIISIVGMGGMGKTTLARHLYNDLRMEGKFDVKAWVCVSDVFDVIKVTRAILEAITKSAHDTRDLNMLQVKLKERLTARKFLLVLDDIWNDNRKLWDALQAPFNYGAQGSKILVTTRNEKVASIMRSNKIRQLKQLQGKHCWQLFAKHAFLDENSQVNPTFKEIGMKIIEKCQGLPLALKTIGSLLYTKSSLLEWENILTSKIWDFPEEDSDIIPALMLSYRHLPSHLKRCFAYCSLFPKNYVFEKEYLILLWMAENFLKCPQQNMTMEEVGEQYFNDMLLRSFFQQSSIEQKCFVMHDLLNDLAKYVSGNFCHRLEVDEAQNISKMTRHCSLLRFGYKFSGWSEVCKAKRLRTFLSRDGMLMHDLCFEFKFLRVLSMSDSWGVTEVPDSIGNFKHLRFLYLSHAAIKKLPDSICLLYNLQILKLNFCRNFEELPDSIGNLKHLYFLDLSDSGIKKLPDSTCSLCNLQILKLIDCQLLKELPLNLHELTNLRHLDFSGTTVRKMPMHMGKLNNLQVLTPFYVGKCSETNIQQLGKLSLHGTLTIGELQNIVSPSDALAANLKNKIHLVKLELRWSADHDDSQQEREVLEKLQPSRHLKELSIRNYGGTKFPNWFGDSLNNLVSLKLSRCENCFLLPPLGLLSSLEELKISELPGIVVIGSEFYGNGSSSSSAIPFPSLKTLSFTDMEGWEEWECKILTSVAAFPCIEELYINNCPNLKEHLPEQLPCLKTLAIYKCPKLVASIPLAQAIDRLYLHKCGKLQLDYHPSTLKSLKIKGQCIERSLLEQTLSNNTSLESLEITDCPDTNIFPTHYCYNFLERLQIKRSIDSLRTFPLDFFPKLRTLNLEECSNLEMVSQEHDHDLEWLVIKSCPKFRSFPKGGFSAPRLQTLRISKLENIRSLPECMHLLLPSLTNLYIYDCPQLEWFSSDEGFPSNLRSLLLDNCSKLVVSLNRVLGTNTSLLQLFISEVDMESFPDQGLLPISLIDLEIIDCPNLKKLDYTGLCHLSSLKNLRLVNCLRLQCLPEEGLPKSISTLEIYGCPSLKQCCQEPNGQDWGKISHIQCIEIDGEEIPGGEA